MSLQQITAVIEDLIAQGNPEQAYDQLVKLLDSDTRYEALAQIARVSQGELYQIKAQVLKGTVSSEEAQRGYNRVSDKALEIINLLQAGKLDLEEEELKPTSRKAWRYYAIGGVVTLVLAGLGWYFFARNQDECPTYAKEVKYRVLILPFRQTGDKQTGEPAIDIADELNIAIEKTPRLQRVSSVEVKQHFDEGYPSPQRAEEIAQDCDVQMVVWGKINQGQDASYKLDVRYRLLNGAGEYISGDTSLSNLLAAQSQGQLVRDLKAVVAMLYVVLANHAHVPADNKLIAEMLKQAPQTTAATLAAPDTSMLLLVAQNYTETHQQDKAIAVYDSLLNMYPSHADARQKRGALLYEKGEYAGALRDFEAAAPNPSTANTDLLKKRTDAALRTSQPVKAAADLKILDAKKAKTDGTWIKQKEKEVQDSLTALKQYRDKMEQLARSQPDNTKAQISAAKANLGLGEPDRALKSVKTSARENPKTEQVLEVTVEAHLQKKDTATAVRLIDKAEKSGVNVKGVTERISTMPQLTPTKKQ